jgi:WD40 repeat protein
MRNPLYLSVAMGLAALLSGASAAAGAPRTDFFGDPLPEGTLARLGTVRFRHGYLSTGVAFSPDGKLLASNGACGRGLCLWDAATGREVRRLEQSNPGGFLLVFSLTFSPDGKTLASAHGGIGRLHDVASGRELWRVPSQKDVHSIAIAPDGRLLATGGDEAVIILWDRGTRKEVRRF